MKVYLLRPLKRGFKLEYERVGIKNGKATVLTEDQYSSNMYIPEYIKNKFIDVVEFEQTENKSKSSSSAKRRNTKKSVVSYKKESESRIVEEDSRNKDLSDATDESIQ